MSMIRGFRNVCLIDSFRATLKLDPLISGSDNTTLNEKPVWFDQVLHLENANSHFHKNEDEHVTLFKADKRSLCLCEVGMLSLSFVVKALCVALSLCNVCCQITDSELLGACLTSHWLRCT